jgi:hypothetical protein
MTRRAIRFSRAGAMDLPRMVLGGLMILALLFALKWLQDRFDASDHRKATELVRSYRASPTGPTIPQAIIARHPDVKEHEISWSSEISSGCLGNVRVSAYVPKKAGRPANLYAFDVRLTDPSIHPTDPQTVEILKSLTGTTASVTRSATTARSL